MPGHRTLIVVAVVAVCALSKGSLLAQDAPDSSSLLDVSTATTSQSSRQPIETGAPRPESTPPKPTRKTISAISDGYSLELTVVPAMTDPREWLMRGRFRWTAKIRQSGFGSKYFHRISSIRYSLIERHTPYHHEVTAAEYPLSLGLDCRSPYSWGAPATVRARVSFDDGTHAVLEVEVPVLD